ncbi:MAG TPA: hypothetical protein VNF70_06485 [Pyrinomonadaceae bacterium]|nr:hypothetical protein [Pyrinomonadaceae bacterium]
MISTKTYRVFLLALVCAVVFAAAPSVFCQEQSSSSRAAVRDDDTNLDTQLYLILATNREIDEGKIPPALDPIMKRLREALPFKHYSIAGTFLNRVKNNGRLDVSWVGSPFLLSSASSAAALSNPSFNQFTALIRLATDGAGNDIVRMNDFRFGAKVPVITGQVTTTNASMGVAPVTQVVYESVGLHTDISMREGAPVLAGTLHVGPQGDAIIVAISAQRAN